MGESQAAQVAGYLEKIRWARTPKSDALVEVPERLDVYQTENYYPALTSEEIVSIAARHDDLRAAIQEQKQQDRCLGNGDVQLSYDDDTVRRLVSRSEDRAKTIPFPGGYKGDGCEEWNRDAKHEPYGIAFVRKGQVVTAVAAPDERLCIWRAHLSWTGDPNGYNDEAETPEGYEVVHFAKTRWGCAEQLVGRSSTLRGKLGKKWHRETFELLGRSGWFVFNRDLHSAHALYEMVRAEEAHFREAFEENDRAACQAEISEVLEEIRSLREIAPSREVCEELDEREAAALKLIELSEKPLSEVNATEVQRQMAILSPSFDLETRRRLEFEQLYGARESTGNPERSISVEKTRS